MHQCQLRLAGRLKPQLYKRNPPARVTLPECFAYKILDILLVRAGGLSFYSRDFQSPGLKLTTMRDRRPDAAFSASSTRSDRSTDAITSLAKVDFRPQKLEGEYIQSLPELGDLAGIRGFMPEVYCECV